MLSCDVCDKRNNYGCPNPNCCRGLSLKEHDDEIYNKALEDFKNKLISDEFQKYNIDFVFETNRDWNYSNCILAFIEYIEEINKELKR